jgi:hypothetical protein
MLAKAEAAAAVAAALPVSPVNDAPDVPTNPTFSILMDQAEEALENDKFIVARALLTDLHEKRPHDHSLVHKLALATYKAKLPTEKAALEEALTLLMGLNPADSTDTETLGLLQAVHKRLWHLTEDRAHLEKAIWASNKGFVLKNDYYNGINLAFLYNVRAAISEGLEAITDFVLAQRIRRRVIEICQPKLDRMQAQEPPKYFDAAFSAFRDVHFWLIATLAEAYVGLGDETKAKEYLDLAGKLNPPPTPSMLESAESQLVKLRGLIANSPVK